jgi:hypothetical protein
MFGRRMYLLRSVNLEPPCTTFVKGFGGIAGKAIE